MRLNIKFKDYCNIYKFTFGNYDLNLLYCIFKHQKAITKDKNLQRIYNLKPG